MPNQHYFINPKLQLKLCIVAIILFCFSVATFAQEKNWMPDPELRQAVREHLDLPQEVLLTTLHLQELTDLIVLSSGISSLQGLEHAVNLRFLHITHSLISDLTPLKNLVSLEVLKLYENQILDVAPLAKLANLEELDLSANRVKDISPLAALVNLRRLYLSTNQIEDVTPLSRLVSLQILDLEGNLIVDITPLKNLVSLEFLNINANVVDESQLLQLDLPNIGVCDLPRLPVKDRIEDRDYPSAFAAWANIINLPTLSESERYARHDLWFGSNELGLNFAVTDNGIHLVGNLREAKRRREELLSNNPNMILLVEIPYYGAGEDYPEDWVSWLRDAQGNRIQAEGWWGYLVDFTLPETQKWTLEHVQAVAKCGLFDGIFLDHWSEGRRLRGYRTSEEEHVARDKILQGIRDAVGEDFLIMVNTNRDRIPRWAKYVNGTFMETLPGITFGFLQGAGYTHADLLEIEETLIWSEKNFREPHINGLEGWGLIKEPPDSPKNRQWMRSFTTMSLTLSDGYVLYVIGSGSFFHEHYWYNSFLPESHDKHSHIHDHDHYWYDFWDAPLGRPVGEKAQLYKNRQGASIEGLFIREFTNGWAVYNRSGKDRTFQLPKAATGVHSSLRKRWHTLPDLDGEIYLKEIIPPDTTRPDVTISVSSDTQNGAFDAVITFTEPISDFGQTDVSISGTATATTTAWTISEDNTIYTATITPTTSGTLILNVNENVAADDANNPNTPATQQTLTVQLILAWDVNRDGQVNVLDLVAVANAFGKDAPDVNGDGVVNILDLVAVAQHFGDATTAAPSILTMNAIHGLDAATVQAWIERAQLENDGSITFQEAIANLQRLLTSLIPKETTLLANYPNPFNPETWIPYHLANPSHVTITIYDIRGSVVRQLNLGHQRQGYYTSRSRAAYWEGRNDVGERVASGVYFYTLTAGDFTATRKMLILK